MALAEYPRELELAHDLISSAAGSIRAAMDYCEAGETHEAELACARARGQIMDGMANLQAASL